VEVAALADTTLVLVAPGMGDGIQAAKAGILEVGDVFAVNKADRDGADATVRELRHVLRMAAPSDWRPSVVATVAATGQGLEELAAALEAHREAMDATGGRLRRRRARAAEEVTALVVAALRACLVGEPGRTRLAELADRVAAGELDPYAAAAQLRDAVGLASAGTPR
jgi:LAO/AO transport system kinase